MVKCRIINRVIEEIRDFDQWSGFLKYGEVNIMLEYREYSDIWVTIYSYRWVHI